MTHNTYAISVISLPKIINNNDNNKFTPRATPIRTACSVRALNSAEARGGHCPRCSGRIYNYNQRLKDRNIQFRTWNRVPSHATNTASPTLPQTKR